MSKRDKEAIVQWLKDVREGATMSELRKEFPNAQLNQLEAEGLIWYNVETNRWYSSAAIINQED